MKAKSKADRLSVRLVHMEILLALALLGVVFLTAAHSDTVSARQRWRRPFDTSGAMQPLQPHRAGERNQEPDAREESVGQIARQMEADGEARAPLSEYAQMGYVSGLVVMDETGCVLSDYHGTAKRPGSLANIWIPRAAGRGALPRKALRHALCLRGREHD